MVGVGYSITQVIGLVFSGVVENVFSTPAIAGSILLIITALWISKAGLNGVGVLVTGWLALFLYLTGAYGFSGVFPTWIGTMVIWIIIILLVYVISKLNGSG